MTRRAGGLVRMLAWVIGALIAVPLLLSGMVLLGANTDPGRRLIETLTASLSQGTVRIEGIAGRFPDALRVHRLTIGDNGGVWLTVNDAALDWSPRRLVHGDVSIDRLEAESVAVARQPMATSPPATPNESGGISVPALRVALSHLRVARLEIGAAVAGQPIALTVEGSGTIVASDTGEAHLAVTALQPREGSPGDHYILEMAMEPSHLRASLAVAEGANGLIAGLAQLPDLGAITIAASVDGPTNALTAKATIAAGELRANLDGTVDMVNRGANLAVSAMAPAMTPGPGLGWSSIRLEGNIHGPFASPEAAGTLSADDLSAAGAAIGSLRANIAGSAGGEAELHARLDGLRVPGPTPDMLASGPLTLDATARLGDANRPLRFTLRHRLFSADGTASTDQVHVDRAHVRLTVPDLTQVAAIGGIDLRGQTELDIDATRSNGKIDLTVKGGVGVTEGPYPMPALVGGTGAIDLAASLRGEDITVSRLSLTGSGFNASANGQFASGRLDADWTLSLNNLSAIRPGASGTVTGHGHVGGPLTSLAVTGDVTGDVAGEGGHLDQVSAHLSVDGLPDAPAGRLTAGGTIMDAPLSVEIGAERRDGGFRLVIDRVTWKSLTAGGTLDLAAGETLPTGKITLSMPRLADLAPLGGRPISGSLTASMDASTVSTRISAIITGAAMPGAGSVGKTDMEATITDPGGHPFIDGTLTLDGLEANGVRASGRLTAKGPPDGMALTLAADAADLHGAPARVQTFGTLNATSETLSLASLQGSWGRETIKLLAPARIGFAQGVAVDRLRVGFRQGELTIAGRWDVAPGAGKTGGAVLNAARSATGGAPGGASGGAPMVTSPKHNGPASAGFGGIARVADAFDVRATLTNLPADIVASVAPAYAADGTISGEAQLTGGIARPQGNIRLIASRLRPRAGPGRAVPPADVTVAATLDGAKVRLDSKLTAGGSSVTLAGLVPPDLAGDVELRIGGTVDLALFNPLLQAQGIDVRGRVDLALAVGGTVAKPRTSGTVRVSNGDFQDFNLGAHISSIAAVVQADGDTIRIERFDGKAGPGTISGDGTVSFAGGLTGTPLVDLTLRASNARILSSDLMTALTDASLSLRGPLSGTPTLGGTVLVRTAEIHVPEKLPPTVAVLPVREAGAPRVKPPPPAPPPPDIALSLTLDVPSQLYVRGRGLDAELGGRVVFAGTAAHPLPQGGLQLRRGAFSLAGQSLNLTEGTIDFTGGGLTNPRLKFVAKSVKATLTSALTISGEVRDPKIVLSSVPDLPQDEILSQLLFNTARARLSPFQLAQIAGALASISGVNSAIGDPLEGLRSRLGLDQLSVGSSAKGGATLQAGRYVARGVRVGAAQSADGSGTQATVQIDIAKGLKLETTAGTASSAATATGSTNGASIGLKYEFEY